MVLLLLGNACTTTQPHGFLSLLEYRTPHPLATVLRRRLQQAGSRVRMFIYWTRGSEHVQVKNDPNLCVSEDPTDMDVVGDDERDALGYWRFPDIS
jgi:hypothetical protein